MNNVVLMGRLTRDPDVRYSNTQNGEQSAIARYTLAVDRPRRSNDPNAQSADFISCIAFGKLGEFAEKYLKQGTKVAVTGRIQTGSYTNKEGNKVYTTDVVVSSHEFAESKGDSSGGGSNAPVSNQSSDAADANEFISIPDGIEEDLPFK